MLLTLATNTYAAYNNVGGKSLYDYISTGRERADIVSFERPLQPNVMGNFYFWDQFFLSWLDAEDISVDYGINADLDAEPELLNAYRANLRIGHDEYNTRSECEQLQQFVKNGGNLLLFAGNCFFHDVEYRNDFRSMYCHKPQPKDPPTAKRPETEFWPYIENMRQRTIGLMYTSFVHAKTDTPGVFHATVTGDGRYGFFRVTEPGSKKEMSSGERTPLWVSRPMRRTLSSLAASRFSPGGTAFRRSTESLALPRPSS